MYSTQHYGADRDGVDTNADAEVTLADGESGPSQARSPFERGETLGRYVALDTLGSGGMGIVLSAYDSKLDRRVALKLLHPHTGADPENHARLIREAQALAKLSHPGVVAVYDVGELRGQVFIAMEFIDGPNLRSWTHEAKRSTAAVLSVFRDAARGLIAAHDAGIVHRDFKPDNVLIDPKGRAHVTDFGLALESHEVVQNLSASSRSDSSHSSSSRLTETGMVMGTPAYMPVEQHAGNPTDHRSDQFSFCVSFYEALYGVRPFSGANATELCLSIKRAEIPPPPAGVSVPRRVHRAIVKGLALKPEGRHASMRALLRAITPPTRNRRTWVFGGLGGLTIGAGVVAFAEPPARPCSSFRASIEDVYGSEQESKIQAAFESSKLAYAGASFEATDRTLDRFTDAWATAATDACLATERGEQSDHMLDLRMHCLDRARSRLSATVEVLSEASPEIVHQGMALASNQVELELCGDLEALQRTVVLPADAEEAAETEQLFTAIDRMEAMRSAGKKEDAKMLFSDYETRLASSDFPPVVASAAWIQGRLVGTDNRASEAITHFRRAYLVSLEHGLDGLAANAASSLGFYYSEFQLDLVEAEHYLDVAAALAKASGSVQAQSGVAGNLSTLRRRQSRYDEAVASAQEALSLAKTQKATRPLQVAEVHVQLANVLRLRDGPKAAIPTLLEARDDVLAELGSVHPVLVGIYREQAGVARELGNYDEAFVHASAALEQARAAYGEGSLDEAYELANLATIAGSLGRKRESLDMLARVDEVFAREQGETHPVRAAVMNNRATIFTELEQWDDAEASFQDALRIAQANADGPDGLSVTLNRNLALVALYGAELSKAKKYADAALAGGLGVHGEDHMDTGMTHAVLGRIALAHNEFEVARASLQRAVTIGHDLFSEEAATRFYLARALVEDPASTPEETRRGLSMARAAEKEIAKASDVERTHTEILEWLGEHDKGFSPG
ncbi:MAG: protein kinase domain-containing protein [Nannocystales bacterium]